MIIIGNLNEENYISWSLLSCILSTTSKLIVRLNTCIYMFIFCLALRGGLVFNVTCNNISAISWRSVLFRGGNRRALGSRTVRVHCLQKYVTLFT
jgi:hypothetical protein